ncbi:MAG: hypothetical protein ACREDT_16435 [Methylocella sp.]
MIRRLRRDRRIYIVLPIGAHFVEEVIVAGGESPAYRCLGFHMIEAAKPQSELRAREHRVPVVALFLHIDFLDVQAVEGARVFGLRELNNFRRSSRRPLAG